LLDGWLDMWLVILSLSNLIIFHLIVTCVACSHDQSLGVTGFDTRTKMYLQYQVL